MPADNDPLLHPPLGSRAGLYVCLDLFMAVTADVAPPAPLHETRLALVVA